jgi:hypothetical protein
MTPKQIETAQSMASQWMAKSALHSTHATSGKTLDQKENGEGRNEATENAK